MDFGANKTPIEVIKEAVFGKTYFRDIYSGINGKCYRNSWKGFDELKNIDQNYCCLNCYNVNVDKYKVECETSLRFWENNGWINSIYCYISFNGIWLGRRSLDDERQITT